MISIIAVSHLQIGLLFEGHVDWGGHFHFEEYNHFPLSRILDQSTCLSIYHHSVLQNLVGPRWKSFLSHVIPPQIDPILQTPIFLFSDFVGVHVQIFRTDILCCIDSLREWRSAARIRAEFECQMWVEITRYETASSGVPVTFSFGGFCSPSLARGFSRSETYDRNGINNRRLDSPPPSHLVEVISSIPRE